MLYDEVGAGRDGEAALVLVLLSVLASVLALLLEEVLVAPSAQLRCVDLVWHDPHTRVDRVAAQPAPSASSACPALVAPRGGGGARHCLRSGVGGAPWRGWLVVRDTGCCPSNSFLFRWQ